MTTPPGGTPPPIDDELLSAYLDGQVSPAERDAVNAAITADPAVLARAADLRATVALLRALPQPVPRRTFILTPEQAAAIRPQRVPWITRLFPTVAAVSAVAAALCLALIAGDLATGGFSTRTHTTTTRPVIESAADATVTRTVVIAAAPTAAPVATAAAAITASGASSAGSTALPAPAAANAPATAPTSAAASARSSGAPVSGAAALAPTVTGAIATAPPLTPTIVANVQSPPPALSAAPTGGATVTKETHRVPVALVRAGEILLALLALAGTALAMLSRRAMTRET